MRRVQKKLAWFVRWWGCSRRPVPCMGSPRSTQLQLGMYCLYHVVFVWHHPKSCCQARGQFVQALGPHLHALDLLDSTRSLRGGFSVGHVCVGSPSSTRRWSMYVQASGPHEQRAQALRLTFVREESSGVRLTFAGDACTCNANLMQAGPIACMHSMRAQAGLKPFPRVPPIASHGFTSA